MANANTSWMPAKGRHRVEIGSSLARYLKSRKLSNGDASAATGKRSHLPDKDFYSFKYKHKPPSMDTKKAGMIQFEQSATHPVLLEHPSVQLGESVMFNGKDQPLKEGDCVLIIDEDTGTFTLEKLEASVYLTYERGLPSIMPRTASPTPSTSTPRGTSNEYTRDDIDREIFDLVGADELPLTTTRHAKKAPPRQEEEEEEEEEDDDDFSVPSRSPPQPKQPAQQPVASPIPAASSRPVKPIPKQRPKALPPQAPVAAPAPRAEVPPRKKTPPKQQSEDDDEDVDVPLSRALPPKPPVSALPPVSAKPPSPAKSPVYAKPAPPVKAPVSAKPPSPPKPPLPAKPPAPTKPMGLAFPFKSTVPRPGTKKHAPPPPPPPQVPASIGLALPGSSAAQTILPSALPRPGSGKPAPVPPVYEVLEDSDEDDETWEEVTTTNASNPISQTELSQQIEEEMEDIFGGEDDAGEEDDFEKQLEREMALVNGLAEEDEEDDDDMEAVVIPEADGPISLHALAGGGELNLDGLSDEYSSSDDSDEDD